MFEAFGRRIDSSLVRSFLIVCLWGSVHGVVGYGHVGFHRGQRLERSGVRMSGAVAVSSGWAFLFFTVRRGV